MKGLYAIVDTKFLERRGTDPIAYARAVLEARPAALQLRAKDAPARAILCTLRALGPLCRQAGVPLVAIGGITLERIHEVAPHADAFAVIADLYPEGATLADVSERARAFQIALGVLPKRGAA